METISGIIERIVLRTETGFVVFALRTDKGVVPVAGDDQDLHEADVVRCEGDWSRFRGQIQFKAKTIIAEIPITAPAIMAYLSGGRIKGISKVFAARLIDAFGLEVLDVIQNNPERLSEVQGFGPKRIKDLIEGLSAQLSSRGTQQFLHRFGLSKAIIRKIDEAYGLLAVEKIKSNPYALCMDIEGLGFVVVDRIGSQTGVAYNSSYRLEAGLMYALGNLAAKSGSTAVEEPLLIAEAQRLLSLEPSDRALLARALKNLEGRQVVRLDNAPNDLIFSEKLYACEVSIATHLARLANGASRAMPSSSSLDQLINDCEKGLSTVLGEGQRAALKTALSHQVSIITGGPGTGKTTIMRVFMECCRKALRLKEDDFLICAPTGKAAKRISQSSGMDASTIHRALAFQHENGKFKFNEHNPLPAKVVIADEFSMADTQVAHWLLQAVSTGSRLVIIGDVDQLSSVGPGRVLRDLIDSKCLPVARLTEIYRQAGRSRIVRNAHRINRGKAPRIRHLGKKSDFWFAHADTPELCAARMMEFLPRLAKHFGYDPFDDIQVLTPVRKGPLGVYALNTAIQAQLNPNPGEVISLVQDGVDVSFGVGDKVMHTKNNAELDVMNGDTGRVIAVDRRKRELKVRYDNREVEYAFADLEHLRLAYAMTIHKSQGSEYPCLLLPASMSHFHMLGRCLYYTGFTRASRTLLVVGSEQALQTAASREVSDNRVTGLKIQVVSKLSPAYG